MTGHKPIALLPGYLRAKELSHLKDQPTIKEEIDMEEDVQKTTAPQSAVSRRVRVTYNAEFIDGRFAPTHSFETTENKLVEVLTWTELDTRGVFKKVSYTVEWVK